MAARIEFDLSRKIHFFVPLANIQKNAGQNRLINVDWQYVIPVKWFMNLFSAALRLPETNESIITLLLSGRLSATCEA